MAKEVTNQIKVNKILAYDDTVFNSVQEYLQSIINRSNEKQKNKQIFYQKANNLVLEEQDLQGDLYFCEYPSPASYSPRFLHSLSSDMEQYINIQKHNFSYVLFLWNDTGIFSITGGQGHNVIESYSDREYGYRFLTYLGENNYKVRSSSEKSIVGEVFSNTRIFRENYDYKLEDHFGKSVDGMNIAAQIDSIKDLFGIDFSGKQIAVNCDIKNGLTIKKKVTIKKIISVVYILLKLNLEKNNFANLKVISESPKNFDLLNRLNTELWKYLSGCCFLCDPDFSQFGFDIMGIKVDEFISAHEYVFIYKNAEQAPICNDFSELKSAFWIIGNQLILNKTADEFQNIFSLISINAKDSEGEILCSDTFFNHIYCEISIDNKTYFRIDGRWSYVDDNFKEKLNNEFTKILPENLSPEFFDIPYSGQKEEQFIDSLIQQPDTYKLHHIYPDGQHEFCDIIRHIGLQTYIVHVKIGTGVELRELTQQIELSVKRYRSCKASNGVEYFEAIYDSMKKNHREKGISREEFINWLNNGNVIFIGLICIKNSANQNVTDAIDSCIAQYSIVNLLHQKNELGSPILFYPIFM